MLLQPYKLSLLIFGDDMNCYIFCLCVSGLYNSFLPASLPTLESLALLHSHGKMTLQKHHRVSGALSYQLRSASFSGRGCCTLTQGITPGDREG